MLFPVITITPQRTKHFVPILQFFFHFDLNWKLLKMENVGLSEKEEGDLAPPELKVSIR